MSGQLDCTAFHVHAKHQNRSIMSHALTINHFRCWHQVLDETLQDPDCNRVQLTAALMKMDPELPEAQARRSAPPEGISGSSI